MEDINVLEALREHFGRDNVIDSGNRAKIKCPFHKNGQERTPSMVVNTREPFLGNATCFGCGQTATLKELLGLDDDANYGQFKIYMNKNLLRDKPDKNVIADWREWKRWPKKHTWRGIPGWLVRDMQGRVEETEYGRRLAMPVIQDGKCHGLIHCSFTKSKLAYIYDKHPYVKQCLFGHDYAKRMMRKSKSKRLMIVEGPRDVMRPMSFGIPTVGNMGGTTVWTKAKADLITFLNPNELVVATDPDEVGNKLALLIKEALPDIRMRRLYLNPEGKEDPGSMKKKRLLKLSEYFE